jgi:Holliday junction resolvase RusA-like endonuclease
MIVAFTIPAPAVPFARAGSNGKRRFTPKKQADFMATVRLFGHRAMRGRALMEGPLHMTVETYYTVPASWSKAKREGAYWKDSKPDADNLYKVIGDSLNAVCYHDDAQIAELTVRKVYGPSACVRVTVANLAALSRNDKPAQWFPVPVTIEQMEDAE